MLTTRYRDDSSIKAEIEDKQQNKGLRVHVVFKGQDERVRRGLEGALCDGLDHLLQPERAQGH